MQRANDVTRTRRASGQRAAGRRHDRRLECKMSYQKSDSINRCAFTKRTIIHRVLAIYCITIIIWRDIVTSMSCVASPSATIRRHW